MYRKTQTLKKCFLFNQNVHKGIRVSFFNSVTVEIKSINDFYGYAIKKVHSNPFMKNELAFGQMTLNIEEDIHHLIFEYLKLPVNSSKDELSELYKKELSKRELIELNYLVHRRIVDKIPVAYLTSKALYQGESLYVNKDTLIPRSYIGEILSYIHKHENTSSSGGATKEYPALFHTPSIKSVLDLCCGSGCLAILASRIFPNAKKIHASDISPAALNVALKNLNSKSLSQSIRVFEGDLFKALPSGSRYDMILCNPPYVNTSALKTLPGEYKVEPKLALFAENRGLEIILRILKEASNYLTLPSKEEVVNDKLYMENVNQNGGILILEIGSNKNDLIHLIPSLKKYAIWLETSRSIDEVFLLSHKNLVKLGHSLNKMENKL